MRQRILIVLTLLAGLLVFTPGTASACSCGPVEPAEAVSESAAVFSGVVADRLLTGESSELGTGVIYTFRVDTAYKGDVMESTQVQSAVHEASCGVKLAVGTRYLIFAYDTQAIGRMTRSPDSVPLGTSLCSGNREVGDSATLSETNVRPDLFGTPATRELIQALGTPKAEWPTKPANTDGLTTDPAIAATPASATGPSDPSLSLWWLLLLIPVGTGTLYAWFRRPSRSRTPGSPA
ncbi:hypothetical protein Acor_41370 [Acrocarpospora corrugata]|uniref:Tissue inhibitor of metalloproteinase n=1 Tax=Acrocarpospora corrugata TaxID=35763 RepID=A0A5M3W215_9ACTN|nr:hypothetical protein [Acrocarpospora corrugata]GES02072.1 hypothetical protein Acor_41370 [Acrocarpospora corrugata]